MQENLYIPKKINVGYQERDDTYTGKLGYVIYWDDKGVLRKETSWQGWRDKEIEPTPFDNVPTEGFVLNREVGGVRESYGWDARLEKVRVYDPRGFEFEINIPNLLFILQECSSVKGKGLEGEFVYAWSGKELVLIPTSCAEYRSSEEFTSLQGKKLAKSDIKEGFVYTTKKNEKVIYIGKFDYNTLDYYLCVSKREKQQIFYHLDTNKYMPYSNFSKIATKNSDAPVDNYAELAEEYTNGIHCANVVGLIDKPMQFELVTNIYNQVRPKETAFVKEAKNKFTMKNISETYIHKDEFYVTSGDLYYISNGKLFFKYQGGGYSKENIFSKENLYKIASTFCRMFLVLDSGKEIDYDSINN